MAFPSSPYDGQQYTSGGYVYQYVAATRLWKKISAVSTTTANATITTANITSSTTNTAVINNATVTTSNTNTAVINNATVTTSNTNTATINNASVTTANVANLSVTGSAEFDSVVLTGGISANGTYGTPGYVLKTNGSNIYWASVTSGGGVDAGAQYTWTNTQTFSNTITFSTTINGTANNSSYLNTKTESNLNVNSALTANASSYLNGKTESNLNVNNSLTSNNSTYLGGKIQGQLNVNNAVTANAAVYLNGKLEADLNVNSALTANASTYLNGKTEINLNVNNSLTANSSTYVNGKAESALNVNSALTANAAGYLNGKTESNLNVNSALTANSSSYLGATAAAGYQTTAGLSANVLTLTANASTYLNGKTEGNLNVNNALTANSASYLGSAAAANFVQNTDSRTLSGNLVFTAANVAFSGNVRISGGFYANGLLGTAGQVLATNGTSVYWTADQVGGGNTTANVITSNTLNSDYINIGVGYVTVGNSTVNTVVANSFVNVGNSTVNASLNSTSLSVSNSTANVAFGLQVFKVPIGSTAQRPTAQTGLLRFNTDTTDLEYAANSSTWYSITTQETLTSNNVSVNNNITVGNATANAVLTRSSLTVSNSTYSTLVSNNSFSISNSSAVTASFGVNAINIGVLSSSSVNNAIAIRQQGQDSNLNPTGPFFAINVPALNGPGGASVIGDPGSLGAANALFMSQNVVLIGNGSVYASYRSANITLTGPTVTGTINSTAFSGSANNTTYVNGKTEGNLNVNNSLTANSASYLGSTAASGYQTTAGLSANVATLTANAANYLGSTAASGYQTTADLSSNVSTLTANAANYLGSVAAANYVQNTDSRTLSGNINFTGTNTYFSGKATHNANLVLNPGISVIDSTGSQGTTGQVLTSNGTGNVYWSTVSGGGGGSVNVAAQYTWTNTQTFSNVITFNSNVNIGTIGATAGILVTNTQIVIGNNSVNSTINSTSFTGSANSANNSSYLGGTAAANFVQNTDTRTLSGNLTFTGANVAFNGTRTFFQNKIQIGNSAGYDFGTTATIEIDTSANTYQQIVIQNANSGTQASGDLVITSDSGNDSVNYVDFGINSSLYSNSTYGITGAGDAYLYSSDSKLVLGTASVKDVIIHAGGTTATNRVLTVNTSAVTVNNLPFNVGTGSVTATNATFQGINLTSNASVAFSTYSTSLSSSSVVVNLPYASMASAGNGYTVEFFVKFTSLGSSQQTISDNGIAGLGFSANTSSIQVSDAGYGSDTLSGLSLQNGVWYHIAYIGRNSLTYIAVNGVVQQIGTGGGGHYGSGSWGGWGNLKGPATFSNFRFVTGQVVYSLSGFAVPSAPLTAISGTYLLTLQDSTFIDNSGSSRSVTTTGSPTLAADSISVSLTSASTVGTLNNGTLTIPIIAPTYIYANSVTGTAGQVLTSNSAGGLYWSTPAPATNVAAQYSWTNTQTFSNTITFSTSILANTVNAASHTVGTSFIANTTGAYHSGIVNAASHTTTGFVANTTAIVPTSNTILLGNTTGRFVLSANTGDFSGSITATGLISTVTGTNTTEILRGNMADNDYFRILIGGTATNAGYAEIATADDGTEPIYVRQYSSTFAVGTIARTATLLDGSGNSIFPQNVNAASYTVGTNFIANTTGTYHSGTMNAASHTVGTNFIANTTQITITVPLSANAGVGSSGQVLTSNGATGAPYWASAAAGTNVAAQYAWTNTQTFSNVITFSSTTASPNSSVGAIVTSGGIGANGNIYTAGRIGFANSAGANQAYTYYNAATSSLDTVFG